MGFALRSTNYTELFPESAQRLLQPGQDVITPLLLKCSHHLRAHNRKQIALYLIVTTWGMQAGRAKEPRSGPGALR